jgi:cytochrome P450
MWSPFQGLARYVAQDCSVGGQTIKAGSVLLLFGSANRDEAEFDHPDNVDIDSSPNRRLAFGTGVHRCIGSNYARAELRIALERSLDRLPDYEIIEDRLCSAGCGNDLRPQAHSCAVANVNSSASAHA